MKSNKSVKSKLERYGNYQMILPSEFQEDFNLDEGNLKYLFDIEGDGLNFTFQRKMINERSGDSLKALIFAYIEQLTITSNSEQIDLISSQIFKPESHLFMPETKYRNQLADNLSELKKMIKERIKKDLSREEVLTKIRRFFNENEYLDYVLGVLFRTTIKNILASCCQNQHVCRQIAILLKQDP